jgi:hypothetical protein
LIEELFKGGWTIAAGVRVMVVEESDGHNGLELLMAWLCGMARDHAIKGLRMGVAAT